MKKNKIRILLIAIMLIIGIVTGGTYAYYIWHSSEGQKVNIGFTAAPNLSCSAQGVDKVSASAASIIPTDCTDSTKASHVIKKEITTTVNGQGVAYTDMWLNVNEIGTYLASSKYFMYSLTTDGTNCNSGIVSKGNFKDLTVGDKVYLLESEKSNNTTTAPTTKKTYYLWIWLDKEETTPAPVDTAARKFNLSLDGACNNGTIVEDFEVLTISNNKQVINATATNSIRNIVAYAVTTSSTVGDSDWVQITDNIGKTYDLVYPVSSAGTYYVWFKDAAGNTVSDSITITASQIDNTKPVCTWGEPSKTMVTGGENITITLSCVDAESGIYDEIIAPSSMQLTNNILTFGSSVDRTAITNGYQYTFTLTAGYTDGSTEVVLPANVVRNGALLYSDGVTSQTNITVNNAVPMGELTVTLNNNNFNYTGNEIKPTVTVKDGSTTLNEGTNYSLTYENNINAGIATVTITGKGKYTGNITKTYTINKIQATCTINNVPALTYPGNKSGTFAYNCTGDGAITVSGGNNIITVNKTSNTSGTITANNEGSSSVIVNQAEGTNYYKANASKDITITVNQYTVTLNANIFNTISATNHGITATYEVSDSYFYVTLNGTQTSETAWLGAIPYGYSFTEGDTFTGKFTYVSGSYSYPSTSSSDYVRLILRTVTVDGTKVAVLNSPRNFVQGYFPSSTETVTTRQMTVNSTVANMATGISLNIYAVTPSSLTFNNYKIKIELTKDETKTINYGNKYGTLPTPTRLGYSFDGWYTGEKGTGTKITSDTVYNVVGNQTLYAKWVDNVPPYGLAKLVLNSGTFTLSLSNQGDDGTRLTSNYGFALISSGSCEAATYTNQTATTKTYNSNLNSGTTYYGCIKLTDASGNVSYLKSGGVVYDYTVVDQTYTTSGNYTYTVPSTGVYKLEAWGAQGGTVTYSSTYRGGYGGYSVGSINLTQGTVLYIYVGGEGSGGSSANFAGGYNGGGATNGTGTDHYHASGGGATHIATSSGVLSTMSNNIGNILIVAGGGGGGYRHTAGSGYGSNGGSGGGYQGVAASLSGSNGKPGLGGTQTAGGQYNGSFGQGGYPNATWGSGGGGGFYGGGGSNGNVRNNGNSGGGGGSGYIGNSLLTDKFMYCYNCTTSNDVATKTLTTSNHSSTPTANYAKEGAGAAKITASIIKDGTTIKMTYNSAGGTGCYYGSVVTGSTYGTLCTPTREGYSFDGWYTALSGGTKITSSSSVSSSSDFTIYAHWIVTNAPRITFGTNGNTDYVSGTISSTITVTKGNANLDSSSLKYIWSTSDSATPNTTFTSGSTVSISSKTGKYYLIAKACGVDGACTTKVSNPFYVDNTAPTGSVTATLNYSTIEAKVTASDSGSGISSYGYLIQTSSSCPTTGYTSSTNANYSFNITTSGTYYICVKLIDKVGNSSYVKSSAISVTSGSSYLIDKLPTGLTKIGNDYRYQGGYVNNYVSFNGELWRIVGVFNINGINKIKIVRNSSIGTMKFSNQTSNASTWSTSLVKSTLDTYYSNLGTAAKAMVDSETWYFSNSVTIDMMTTEAYTAERNGTANTGYIGILYPSDYGYATASYTSSSCKIRYYGLYGRNCAYNNKTSTDLNWIYRMFYGTFYWFMGGNSTSTVLAYRGSTTISGVSYPGNVEADTANSVSFAVAPSLYLKGTVTIASGSGTSSDPFVLG